MKPIVACGTEDEEELYMEHFGESPYFQLYNIKSGKFNFIEQVENFSREEGEDELHEEPIKARHISSLLKAKSVNILLAHQMEANTLKVSKSFVPVLSNEINIEKALQLVRDNLHLVEREWRKGDQRDHLVLGE